MSRSLEITILSAEDLRVNKKSIKKNAFVTLKTDASSAVRTTRMDVNGGSYPTWNEKVIMDVPLHASFITLEVNYKAMMGINSVGISRIPISDIVGGYVPQNQVQFLSYRLWDRKIKRNGVINFSVRVKMPVVSLANGLPPSAGNSSNAVVTGIPVNWV
ncbi:hypothetical protein HN51_046691 [Arachis hypogaea]|uniref:C2 domain-containing protein n=1 Tax=Arachis hypogaea TaxID=3818 RepID=A0A445ADR6_ARAHY|nr:BON1-associated protein 2 [Arachis hypogaea]QHO22888.1 BON1-associated protein [Arachis hypogaea]RYR24548.1 hypothetical protein Ahy_B02g058050 [Arachis hypogaea]